MIGLLTVFIFYQACNAQEKIVRVATLGDYAPFCLRTGNENISNRIIAPGDNITGFEGYCWDVVRKSFHEMGYTIQLSVSPWARAMLNLKHGKADILFPAGINSDRKKIFDYSKSPTNTANFIIYVRADSAVEWKGLEGLNGLMIAVKRGFNYGDNWETATGFTKYDVTDISSGFKMLATKRVDGFLGYEYNWDYYLKQNGLTKNYKKMPSIGSSAEYLVALKTNPKGNLFLEAFDTGKMRLAKKGILEEIKTAWFGKPPE